MARRTRSLLLAAGLLAPVVVLAAPQSAQAIDQDLVVSATNGPPGTQVAVSSASCTSDQAEDVERFLIVRLISGVAPDEVLAASAGAEDGDAAVLVVPDWVDPDQPAAIEASCFEYDYGTDTESEAPYDVVAFDVEPGVGAPTQVWSPSRTSLLAGQGFGVTGSGCTVAGAEYVGVDIVAGDDLSGRSWDEVVGYGWADLEGADFEGEAYLSNGEVGWYASQVDDGPVVVEDLVELPTDIPPGTYTVIVYCGAEDEYLLYEPKLIEVTGDAPFADLDLTSPEGTRQVDLVGGSCTAGDVFGYLSAMDLESSFSGFDAADTEARAASVGAGVERPDWEARARGRRSGASARIVDRATRTVSQRALGDADIVEFEVLAVADGSWAVTDEVTMDRAIVDGQAACGDPLADGFLYDPQIVEVEAAVAPPTTTTTTTAPPPAAPAPANAVPGRPSYAG